MDSGPATEAPMVTGPTTEAPMGLTGPTTEVPMGSGPTTEAPMERDPAADAAKDSASAGEPAMASDPMDSDRDSAAAEAAKDGDASEDGPVDLDDVYNQGVSSHIGQSGVLTRNVEKSVSSLFLRPRQVAYQLGRHTVSTYVTQLEVRQAHMQTHS